MVLRESKPNHRGRNRTRSKPMNLSRYAAIADDYILNLISQLCFRVVRANLVHHMLFGICNVCVLFKSKDFISSQS